MVRQTLTILAACIVLTGCSGRSSPELITVEHLSLDRYLGTWIEIARYENRFEHGCVGATAHYTHAEGNINVLNRCFDAQGTLLAEAAGKAYATDGSNAKLRVTFFWPFYGDYQVFMLADDYRYSVVGDPSRKYLWILSRTRELSEADKSDILTQLPRYGYDPSKLYWTAVRP